jgi:hypothetical protein
MMDSRSHATVTCELALELVVPGDAAVPLPVTLSYDATDPYAVHAVFRTGQGDGVEWVFARELLAGGVVGMTGEGDVRVWPADAEPGSPAASAVNIALASPDGEALLAAPAGQLIDFVERTYDLVPEGCESLHLDVDATIQALLG